ncbi:glycosyltransferase [Algoriphagus sp. H41]|uniref:Glycosyltransferase n=1 Tax=Algoriphagus oliviformis TaxID=2811231 RepID=A0ABS3C0X7_9BACT|nr:glycosyltransferase [Algoriphagus oliviformis]MBN7810769.1 glycosyltransferase [Algoriphagus oliviformis]
MIQSKGIVWSNLYFTKLAGNKVPEQQENMKEVDVELSSPRSIFKFLRDSFRFIRRQKVKGELNVFYAYDTPDLKTILPILYAKMLGYKVILDIVEDNSVALSFDGVMNRVRIKSGQYLLNMSPFFADMAIVISSHLKGKLDNIYNDLSRVLYIPVTVDLKKIKYTPTYRPRVEKVFYGGSFGKKDGLDVLIKAFSRVSGEFPHAELILTGKGENKKDFNEIMDLIAASDAATQIKYLGFLNSEDYLRVLGECDVFCVTRNNSKAANTGFPSKLSEFLAAGKAVIASSVGDVGTILKNEENALLISPEDEQAMYHSLKQVFSDSSLIEKLGTSGRKTAEENFDNRKFSNLLFERLKFLEN